EDVRVRGPLGPRLRRRGPRRDCATGGPHCRPGHGSRQRRGRRRGVAGRPAHPCEGCVFEEPLQPPDGREPGRRLAVPSVRLAPTARGAGMARGEGPRERRGRSDRHDACDAEGDGGVDPRDRSREDGGSRTRFRQLDLRGALVVLDRYRKAADRLLVPVASRLIHVNPNVVSWIAFFAAVGAGVSFFLGGAGRLVLLFLGGLIQLIVAPSGGVTFGAGPLMFGPLEWFLVLFAVLGNATAIQRGVKTWRGFSD